MKQKKGQTNLSGALSGFLVLAILAAFLLPWRNVNWGKMQYTPAEVVTVAGEAKSQEANSTAVFSAGVDAVNNDKDAAVKEVNDTIKTVIESMKKFGIAAEDIKTQNMSIYQNEESFWEDGVQRTRKGQWRVNNSIEIKLRDMSKASELTDLLTSSGANNVWGPNFQLEDTSEQETALFEAAMENAKVKAEAAASAAGRKLGKVLSVTEGVSGSIIGPMYRATDGMGGGAALEPGTSTVSKSLTVTFELN
ncbi:TPA: hypothetical protein DCQ19_02280 [Candidatus Shapirobacteria bacterium]|nr:hypothetical protein [Candidatus Shapirobacteria bacterium]